MTGIRCEADHNSVGIRITFQPFRMNYHVRDDILVHNLQLFIHITCFKEINNKFKWCCICLQALHYLVANLRNDTWRRDLREPVWSPSVDHHINTQGGKDRKQ